MAGRWMMATIQTSFAVMPALVYLFAGLDGGAVSIGTVVAFTTLQTRLFWPIQSLLNVGVDIQTLDRAVRARVRVPRPAGRHPPRHARRSPPPRGDVAPRRRLVPLRRRRRAGRCAGVDLDVPAGTRTAIVGETGSGKTTLGYLVARLYDAERGAVRIDGVDVRELTLRRRSPTRSASSRRRPTCSTPPCARTCASRGRTRPTRRSRRRPAPPRSTTSIAALPDGYDTVVGERGFRFSGGEKQRIAIARTILRNPPVLVLDEATSALDVQTERAVEEALERLAEGRTTIVIAHRLSTVRDADQIVVLDARRVAERGTHDELLARGGRYAAMVARDAAPQPV